MSCETESRHAATRDTRETETDTSRVRRGVATGALAVVASCRSAESQAKTKTIKKRLVLKDACRSLVGAPGPADGLG